jgi:hypothetical protein
VRRYRRTTQEEELARGSITSRFPKQTDFPTFRLNA